MRGTDLRACSRGLLAGLFLGLAGSGPVLAQRPADSPASEPRAREAEERARFLLRGHAQMDDGSPAEGAVVESSAGGRAVTDARGDYELEIEVPRGVERLELRASAVAQGLGASMDLALPRVAGVTRGIVLPVDVLRLSGASGCEPSWLPTFGGEPGFSNSVAAFAVFDDGAGPALYVGGYFQSAGGLPARFVARWSGSHWSALGSGPSNGVEAMAVHDDGSGRALYVGGGFSSVGGIPANKIARWDGTSWSAVGNLPFGVGVGVRALGVHDDGSGPALYASGTYGTVAKWDGSSWSQLPPGPDDTVLAFASFDDGSGPALYAGGTFLRVNGVPMPGVARWNGTSWSGVGSGRSGVSALIVHDDGSGPRLYAGGSFNGRIARWNGSVWSTVGSGFDSSVYALALHDDGNGPELYAGGYFTRSGGMSVERVARWNGSSWSALGSGANGELHALASFDDGAGARLYAGGIFSMMGGQPANRFASWDGTSWAAHGDGPSSPVLSLAVHDDGTGRALYAGGYLGGAGGVTLNGIGRWSGAGWAALGSGMDGHVHRIEELAVHDDGSGPALYAAGMFSSAGGTPANSIAKWNGFAWSALGSGMGTPGNLAGVETLASFDDGSGPGLYAGGGFLSAGGVPALNIARWNGASWTPLGAGLNQTPYDLRVFDDGSGPALFATGNFALADNHFVNYVAKWDGASWSPLGAGLNGGGRALAVHDDGSGPALYVGGTFSRAGGLPALRVARWDGASWTPVGGLDGFVDTLAVHDDGQGPALYAGGSFFSTGIDVVNHIARWNGAQWQTLGGGLNGNVEALATFDDGGGPALFAGGWFAVAPDSGDSYLAKWGDEDVRIDFSTEDDFATALVNGQALSTPPEFGRLFSLTSSGPNAGAAIFDSTPGGPNDPSQDLDLLVGRGNVLVLQTNQNTTQTVPGIFDRPNDDSDGGSLVFQFQAPVLPLSLDLIDIDSGASESSAVILSDQAGRLRTYVVPRGWTGDRLTDGTPGVRTLDLTTLDPQPGYLAPATAGETLGFTPERVLRIEVRLGGSGAVDELHWCPHGASADTHGPRAARGGNPAPIAGPILR